MEVFEEMKNGRKIYRNKPDTALLRLNHPLMKRILVPTDFSEQAENALKVAAEIEDLFREARRTLRGKNRQPPCDCVTDCSSCFSDSSPRP